MPRRAIRKKKRSKKEIFTHTWQESFSLGAGLLFLSILSFTSLSFAGGVLLFLVGLYFLIHGSYMKNKKGGSLTEWMSYKILQSLVMVALGIILMHMLPARFFGPSLLITILGLILFLHLKFRTRSETSKRSFSGRSLSAK